jgi:hypothetical protein
VTRGHVDDGAAHQATDADAGVEHREVDRERALLRLPAGEAGEQGVERRKGRAKGYALQEQHGNRLCRGVHECEPHLRDREQQHGAGQHTARTDPVHQRAGEGDDD